MPEITFPIPVTEENVSAARDFVLRMWRKRATDENEIRGRAGMRLIEVPSDLSNSCKFSSMFAAVVFGGKLRGNYDHQFTEIPGYGILDLNGDAPDVAGLLRAAAENGGPHPYRHDARFFGKGDHRTSMKNCESRVKAWLAAFREELEARSETAPAMR